VNSFSDVEGDWLPGGTALLILHEYATKRATLSFFLWNLIQISVYGGNCMNSSDIPRSKSLWDPMFHLPLTLWRMPQEAGCSSDAFKIA